MYSVTKLKTIAHTDFSTLSSPFDEVETLKLYGLNAIEVNRY
jgi:hypothetical protein